MRGFAIYRVRINVKLASFSQKGAEQCVTFQRVKSICEVQLQNNVFRILLVLNDVSKNLCCDFSSRTCSAAELRTIEFNSSLVHREGAHTKRAYPTQGISNRNWSNFAVFFPKTIKFSTKEKGLNHSGTLPSKTIFSTLVRFWRNSLPKGPLLFAIRSLYNCGTSRLGPLEDRESKELTAFATVGSNVIRLSSTTCWARFAAVSRMF